jgi:thymidylate synthase
MIFIKGKTANEIFIEASKKLKEEGSFVAPRNMMTKELNDVWLELENPGKSIVTLHSRNTDMDYLRGELKWYLSGSTDVKDISKHSSFWNKLADTNGTINSNYGHLALKSKYAGKSQYEWCVDSIKKDLNTRQAIINYNQPKHKYPGNKDFVCTIAQHFIVRNGKLDSIVFMRSNDLIFGLTYDMPWFCLLQKKIAKELRLPLGSYKHFTTSLHVYEKHWSIMREMSQEDINFYP